MRKEIAKNIAIDILEKVDKILPGSTSDVIRKDF